MEQSDKPYSERVANWGYRHVPNWMRKVSGLLMITFITTFYGCEAFVSEFRLTWQDLIATWRKVPWR